MLGLDALGDAHEIEIPTESDHRIDDLAVRGRAVDVANELDVEF